MSGAPVAVWINEGVRHKNELFLSGGGGARREVLYALASALIFAGAHQLAHPVYYVAYAATGAALAFVYIRARSLNAAILAHAVINAIYHYRALQ